MHLAIISNRNRYIKSKNSLSEVEFKFKLEKQVQINEYRATKKGKGSNLETRIASEEFEILIHKFEENLNPISFT